MFWEDVDPIATPRLERAVAGAYDVFSAYRLRGTIVHCSCPVCMTDEIAQALSNLPLKNIPSDMLAEYTNSAHGYDKKDIEREFKHFLPRYLDLIAACDPPCNLGLETCLSRLREAAYRERWPAPEVAAVDEVFDAFVEASVGQLGLIEWPVGLRLEFDMTEVITMVVQAGGDLDRVLGVLDTGSDPAAAIHMASMRADVLRSGSGYRLEQAFLDEFPLAAATIGGWLMRDSVSRRIETAIVTVDDEDYDDVLALGMDT
ncbi:MAG: hypothetical protein RLZ98_1804 [Pseudomonadota bacterium]|jgi:hypothetical protein